MEAFRYYPAFSSDKLARLRPTGNGSRLIVVGRMLRRTFLEFGASRGCSLTLVPDVSWTHTCVALYDWRFVSGVPGPAAAMRYSDATA